MVVALFTAVLGGSYFPSAVPGIAPWAAYALGLATVLGLLASVIAHELGHALVARRDGVEIEEIDLWPLGGISRMRELPATPAAELRMALAGPAVSVMLAVALAGIALVLPGTGPWRRRRPSATSRGSTRFSPRSTSSRRCRSTADGSPTIGHVVKGTDNTYGTFATVIGFAHVVAPQCPGRRLLRRAQQRARPRP